MRLWILKMLFFVAIVRLMCCAYLKEQLHIYTIWPLVACIFLSVELIFSWFSRSPSFHSGQKCSLPGWLHCNVNYLYFFCFDIWSFKLGEMLNFYIFAICQSGLLVYKGEKISCYNNSTSGGAVTQEEMRDSMDTSGGCKSIEIHGMFSHRTKIMYSPHYFLSCIKRNVAFKCCQHLL